MRFILETERLILREFATSDLEPLSKILSDPVTMQFYPAPLNRDQVAEWITRNQNRYREIGYGLWAMLLKITGELIGDCGLTRQTVDRAAEIEIGYHVRRDLWGRGYAPEAAVAARDWGFKTLEVSQLISLVRVGNLPSRRVAEKAGMQQWKTILWRDLEHWIMRIERAQKEKGELKPAPK